MGLEAAQYIPELVDTNPIGATDPVSQGDDHLRLIKLCLQNSFSGFVGTTGTPKSVTLTEDQINVLIDAALTNIDNNFSAIQTFAAAVNLDAGFNADESGAEVARTEARAAGSLLIADILGGFKKAGFRNPGRFGITGANAFTQDYEGQQVEFTGAGANLTVNSLAADTQITLLHRGTTDCDLVEGSATINWIDGSGAAVGGSRVIAPNSVVHMSWRTGGAAIDIWGNGIS
jgi:hypothetical protein